MRRRLFDDLPVFANAGPMKLKQTSRQLPKVIPSRSGRKLARDEVGPVTCTMIGACGVRSLIGHDWVGRLRRGAPLAITQWCAHRPIVRRSVWPRRHWSNELRFDPEYARHRL